MNNEIKKRNTKQKSILLEYLKENKEKHLTAEQILNNLSRKDNSNISQATIYRLLNSLTNDGKLRKFFVDEKTSCCYQYIDDTHQCSNHYHMVCDSCNKVFHFEEDLITKLKDNILKSSQFDIDTSKILFYGKCKKCLTKEKKYEKI